MTHLPTRLSDPELFTCYRSTQDVAIRDELVARHDWLALQCAARFRRNMPNQDLDQVARIGLVLAVTRFEPARGTRFTTFARPTINGELKRHLRDTVWPLAVPRRVKELRSAWTAASQSLLQTLGRPPTMGELADELGLPPDLVSDIDRAGRTMMLGSLDHPAAIDPVAPIVSGNNSDSSLEGELMVRSAIRSLSERDRQIVVWYYYEDCTQSEIGERLGISQAQVSRLLIRLMAELEARLGGMADEAEPDAEADPGPAPNGTGRAGLSLTVAA